MPSPARQIAETFAGRTYSDHAEAMSDLERLIERALLAQGADLATALRDCVSTFRTDDLTTMVTAERQEAWRAALLRYDPEATFPA